MSTAQSLTNSSVSNYKHICQRIISGDRSLLNHHPNNGQSVSNQESKRLTFKQIQNITKSMMKDKKAHEHNLGVLHNIKGKMYCLKLGQVSNFKEFSHYFYTSQYRRKQLKPVYSQYKQQQQYKTQYSVKNQQPYHAISLNKKISTEPSQNMACHAMVPSTKTSIFYYEDNQEQIKKIQEVQQVQQLQIDQKLKQKINRFILPVVSSADKDKVKGKERQGTKNEDKLGLKKDNDKRHCKQNRKMQQKQATRRYSVSRML